VKKANMTHKKQLLVTLTFTVHKCVVKSAGAVNLLGREKRQVLGAETTNGAKATTDTIRLKGSESDPCVYDINRYAEGAVVDKCKFNQFDVLHVGHDRPCDVKDQGPCVKNSTKSIKNQSKTYDCTEHVESDYIYSVYNDFEPLLSELLFTTVELPFYKKKVQVQDFAVERYHFTKKVYKTWDQEHLAGNPYRKQSQDVIDRMCLKARKSSYGRSKTIINTVLNSRKRKKIAENSFAEIERRRKFAIRAFNEHRDHYESQSVMNEPNPYNVKAWHGWYEAMVLAVENEKKNGREKPVLANIRNFLKERGYGDDKVNKKSVEPYVGFISAIQTGELIYDWGTRTYCRKQPMTAASVQRHHESAYRHACGGGWQYPSREEHRYVEPPAADRAVSVRSYWKTKYDENGNEYPAEQKYVIKISIHPPAFGIGEIEVPYDVDVSDEEAKRYEEEIKRYEESEMPVQHLPCENYYEDGAADYDPEDFWLTRACEEDYSDYDAPRRYTEDEAPYSSDTPVYNDGEDEEPPYPYEEYYDNRTEEECMFLCKSVNKGEWRLNPKMLG
jgi:hypothetical protein